MPQSKKPTSKKTAKKEEEIQSVKGTRDLIGPDVFLFQGFMEKAAEIALYYGFQPIETPILEKTDLFIRGVGDVTDIVEKEMYNLKTKGGDKLSLRPEGTAAVMRAYFEHGMQSKPQPVMLYYGGPFFRHEKPQQGRFRQFYQFGFEILGTKKSIADATVIRLTTLVLAEAGIDNIKVKINSIGDEASRTSFKRELLNYYKKQARNICADCRERLKKNPLRVLDCKDPKCQPIKQDAPESISYLTPETKQHFKEVLEYLEMMDIPYEIDNTLVRGLDYYSHTVFEVITVSEEEDSTPLALAAGGRYNNLSKMMKAKKDVPGVGSSIGVDRIVTLPNYKKLAPRIVKKPKIFFIQLSFEAKLKAFTVIEILRNAKIPVAQSLSKDSLGAQLAISEKMKVPYTIILGQKEAMDNTVIIRNMDTRSQDTIPINKLPEYIKKM